MNAYMHGKICKRRQDSKNIFQSSVATKSIIKLYEIRIHERVEGNTYGLKVLLWKRKLKN